LFTGSWIGQGDRGDWLKKINKDVPITVFSWNHKDWPEEFDARPSVYGEDYNKIIADSKVVLGFSVNPHCWGYWSNRVGKVVQAGGILLYQYAPGMETQLGDSVEYFSTAEEAVSKAKVLIENDDIRFTAKKIAISNYGKFTSDTKIRQLMILAERFIMEDNGKLWNQLPINL